MVENYGPGTMERLRCGYGQLAAQNPPLVYLALKGFLAGPYERRPALDEVVEFHGRLRVHNRAARAAAAAGASVVDILGDVFGVVAELAALQERAQRRDQGHPAASAVRQTRSAASTAARAVASAAREFRICARFSAVTSRLMSAASSTSFLLIRRTRCRPAAHHSQADASAAPAISRSRAKTTSAIEAALSHAGA